MGISIDVSSIAHDPSVSVEKLETLPAGTKPRTSHHRSPGGERRKKRKRWTIFLERDIVNQTNTETVSKVTLGKTSQKRGGAHMSFSKRIDTILN